MKLRERRWQHRLNREHPTCTERGVAQMRVRMEGGRQYLLGSANDRAKRKRSVDTDRPSHGRPMHASSVGLDVLRTRFYCGHVS
jgi:hypothetical protein